MCYPSTDAAGQVVELIRQGQLKPAAKLLHNNYSHRLMNYFSWNGYEQDSKELTQDTLMGFISAVDHYLSKGETIQTPEALLRLVRNNTLIDFVRKTKAVKRGRDALLLTLNLDDESDRDALEAHMPRADNFVNALADQDCVRRALFNMSQRYPQDVLLLRMRVLEDMDYEDILSVLLNGQAPDNPKRALATLRQRFSMAIERARDYLNPCKD